MAVNIAGPGALLAPFVKQYWSVDHCLYPGKRYDHRIIPSGLPELTFYLGYRPEVRDSSKNFSGYAVISGQLDHHYDLGISNSLRMFSVSLRPQAIPLFLKTPASLYFNRNVSLTDIIGTESHRIEDLLYHSLSFEEQIIHMENFLAGFLAKHYAREPHVKFRQAGDHIIRNGGNVSVGTLASMACMSLKHYERCFAQQMGCSPKQFLRIVRFQYSLHQRKAQPDCELASLAAACGYYDQAHMNRDFQAFTGLSPGRFFSLCNEGSDLFG